MGNNSFSGTTQVPIELQTVDVSTTSTEWKEYVRINNVDADDRQQTNISFRMTWVQFHFYFFFSDVDCWPNIPSPPPNKEYSHSLRVKRNVLIIVFVAGNHLLN